MHVNWWTGNSLGQLRHEHSDQLGQLGVCKKQLLGCSELSTRLMKVHVSGSSMCSADQQVVGSMWCGNLIHLGFLGTVVKKLARRSWHFAGVGGGARNAIVSLHICRPRQAAAPASALAKELKQEAKHAASTSSFYI